MGGRGGHGGHGGGHHHGGHGFTAYSPYAVDDSWSWHVTDEDDPDWVRPQGKSRYREVGAGELSTGTGGLIVLGLLAYLVFETDKRVPR